MTHTGVLDQLRTLLLDVAHTLKDHELPGHATMLEHASRLARPRTESTVDHVSSQGDIAAERHLPAALAAARRGPAARVTSLLEPLVQQSRWTQTKNYVTDPPHPNFLANYAHTALLGPEQLNPVAVDETDAVTVGLLLLGPGNVYPHHHHPADEIYLPLHDSRWSHGTTQPMQWEPPHVPIHHEPWQSHAAQAPEDRPLLVIYLWTGDRSTSAHFITDKCSTDR